MYWPNVPQAGPGNQSRTYKCAPGDCMNAAPPGRDSVQFPVTYLRGLCSAAAFDRAARQFIAALVFRDARVTFDLHEAQFGEVLGQ
jgi:hypothetical protein